MVRYILNGRLKFSDVKISLKKQNGETFKNLLSFRECFAI